MNKKIGWKKIMVFVLLALVAVIVAVYAFLYVPKISTMASVTKVSSYEGNNLYRMDYTADYHLDKIVQSGAGDTAEFTELALKTMLPGLPIHMDPVEIECSACRTFDKEGNVRMGRNFDLDDTSCVAVFTHPKDGYASIGFSNLSYLGFTEADGLAGRVASLLLPYTTMDGMNEKGLACCMLWLDDAPTVQNTGKTPITTTVAERLLLDRAADVEEAIELLSYYDMRSVSGGDYHFFLVDEKGNSAIVEWPEPGDEMVVTRDVDLVANFFVTDVPEGVKVGHGQERVEKMREKLEELGGFADTEGTFRMMESAQQTVKTEISGTTQWSTVYEIGKRKVSFVLQRRWGDVFEFELKEK